MPDTETTADPSAAESETTERDMEYVANSSKRESILRRLIDGPAPASEIAEKQSVSHGTSRKTAPSLSVTSTESNIDQLRDRGLVELLEADDLRVYSLTASGERVLFALDRNSES